MADEEKPKSSRFRRSRFRMPKGPGGAEGGEGGEEAPAPTGAAPATPAAAAPPPPPPAPAPPPMQAAAPPMAQPSMPQTPVAPPQQPQFGFDPGMDLQQQMPMDEGQPDIPIREVVNVLTIDVKEWFQTAACSSVVKFSHWSKYERRVEQGIHMILALLRQFNVKATFFVLGIVAREFPEMIRLIIQEGHELGTMGYYNRMLYTIPPKEYINELEMSLSLILGITGRTVNIHRAPEFSVTPQTLWYLDILKTYGIKYDSSIYPVNASYYGIEDAPRHPYIINPQGIIECPPTTVPFAGRNIALFGGTYMRVLPYKLIQMGFDSVNRQGIPVTIHISPWEVEAEFPKLNLGWEGYLAQYAGIKSTFSRLTKMLCDFRFETLTRAMEELPPADHLHMSGIGRKRQNMFGGPEME